MNFKAFDIQPLLILGFLGNVIINLVVNVTGITKKGNLKEVF